MTQYPGSDPSANDPFGRPHEEGGSTGAQGSTPPSNPWGQPSSDDQEHTQPVAGAGSSDRQQPEREIGYWERQALDQQAREAQQNQGQGQGYGQGQGQYGAPAPQSQYGPGQYGQPGQYGPHGYSPYPVAPPHPQATTALVLGLVGLVGSFVCLGVPLVLCPFAWGIGRKAVKEIDASNGQMDGRGNAQAGMVMGIIGTVLLILGILAIGALVIVGVAASNSGGPYSGTGA